MACGRIGRQRWEARAQQKFGVITRARLVLKISSRGDLEFDSSSSRLHCRPTRNYRSPHPPSSKPIPYSHPAHVTQPRTFQRRSVRRRPPSHAIATADGSVGGSRLVCWCWCVALGSSLLRLHRRNVEISACACACAWQWHVHGNSMCMCMCMCIACAWQVHGMCMHALEVEGCN